MLRIKTMKSTKKPISSYVSEPIDYLGDIVEGTAPKTDKNLEDLIEEMHKVFGKVNPNKETLWTSSRHKIIDQDSKQDLRLAELGIDRRFELDHSSGNPEYVSHLFCICDEEDQSTGEGSD